jgi:hypothetical protein
MPDNFTAPVFLYGGGMGRNLIRQRVIFWDKTDHDIVQGVYSNLGEQIEFLFFTLLTNGGDQL